VAVANTQIQDALLRVAISLGVRVRTSAKVVGINTQGASPSGASQDKAKGPVEQRVTGVTLDTGEVLEADVVVSNRCALWNACMRACPSLAAPTLFVVLHGLCASLACLCCACALAAAAPPASPCRSIGMLMHGALCLPAGMCPVRMSSSQAALKSMGSSSTSDYPVSMRRAA
jgi:hypothetical protein